MKSHLTPFQAAMAKLLDLEGWDEWWRLRKLDMPDGMTRFVRPRRLGVSGKSWRRVEKRFRQEQA